MPQRRIVLIGLAALCIVACAPDAETEVASTTIASPDTDEALVTTTTTAPVSTPPVTAAAIAPATSLSYVDEEDSVLEIIQSRNDTTRFTQLAATLDDDVFRQARGVTVLVPVDTAWNVYGTDAFGALLDDPTAVALLVSEHLSIGAASLDELVEQGSFSNAMARALGVRADGGVITIGGAAVVVPDLVAENGVVHLVDAVIEP